MAGFLSGGSNRFRRPQRALRGAPFVSGRQRVIVHCANHRVGTVWFKKVLSGVADHFGLTLQERLRRKEPIDPKADIIFQAKAHLPLDALSTFRASHMVRDPRDMIVSGYHYHLWTTEPWVHMRYEQYGGKTYQEYLLALDEHDGLMAELERQAASLFKYMAMWNYHRPEFLELRYEEVISDDQAWFARLFEHYGFHEEAIGKALEIAGRFSFESVSGRRLGENKDQEHLRSGAPGQWRQEFSPAHIAAFKELTGDLVVRLGYETDGDW